MSLLDVQALRDLKLLYDEGVLTAAEFAAKKAVILRASDGRELHITAASDGNCELIQALLAAGEAVDQEYGSDGWTALFTAAHQGRGEVVRVLLAAGANPNHVDRAGTTALMLNMRYGFPGESRDGGRFPDRSEFSTSTFYQLLQAGAEIDRPDRCNGSALIEAVESGLAECVECLVARGADVNRVHRDTSSSVLGYAVINASYPERLSFGSERIVRCLINAGANVNYEMGADEGAMDIAQWEMEDAMGETAFERTVRLGARRVMWILLKGGAMVRWKLIYEQEMQRQLEPDLDYDLDDWEEERRLEFDQRRQRELDQRASAFRYFERVVLAKGFRSLVAIYRRVLTAPKSALAKFVEIRFGRAAPPEILALILEFWKPPGGP